MEAVNGSERSSLLDSFSKERAPIAKQIVTRANQSIGEFGPILIFSGATRMRTEVLPTTVFLELSVGRIEAAIAVSLLMIAAAVVVLVLTRTFGLRGTGVV